MNWAKTQAEADIASFQAAVIDASVEEVDEPTGRKRVEIAFEDDVGFTHESGEAYGVYRDWTENQIHVDWTDDRDRTTAPMDGIVTLNEEWVHDRSDTLKW